MNTIGLKYLKWIWWKAEVLGGPCHQGVIRTCSEKIRNSAGVREERMRSSFGANSRRQTMTKSSTVASSTPSQGKASSKTIPSATSSPHQMKQQPSSQQWKPNQNQLRRKLSRKLELMPQLDWRAFQGSGVTKLCEFPGWPLESAILTIILSFFLSINSSLTQLLYTLCWILPCERENPKVDLNSLVTLVFWSPVAPTDSKRPNYALLRLSDLVCTLGTSFLTAHIS